MKREDYIYLLENIIKTHRNDSSFFYFLARNLINDFQCKKAYCDYSLLLKKAENLWFDDLLEKLSSKCIIHQLFNNKHKNTYSQDTYELLRIEYIKIINEYYNE